MMEQIYAAIDQAIAKGIKPQYIADVLVGDGYPKAMVNQAINAYLLSHGRLQKKTGFQTWLKKYKRQAMPAVSLVVILSVISSAIVLLKPWPTKIMVDSAFGQTTAPDWLGGQSVTHTPRLILLTSLLTIAIFFAGSIFNTIRDFTVLKLGYYLNRDIKIESFRHILFLPLYHQQRLAKGDYIYRQNVLTDSLSDLVLDTTSSIIQSVIMILGILVIMLTFDVKLTLISIVVVPFLYILIKVFGPLLGKISQQISQTASSISSTITESVDNAETVQSFNLEDKQVMKARDLWNQKYNLTKKGLAWSRLYSTSNSLLIILGTSSVMYLGGTAALNGKITLGQLLIFMTYMGYLLDPVQTLAAQISTRNQKIVDISRVYEVLTDHEGAETLRDGNHLPLNRGRVEFQNVSYSYNNMQVLDDVSLAIEPGQKVGIIGPSGAGKSTLLKLLTLFIEPERGRVMIDGVDIQTVSLKELRQNVGWIAQSPQLFSGTIVDNLQDGDVSRKMTVDEVETAINVSNVAEFANRLPDGVLTQVGEGGGALSGGQRQRVAIARGLLKNAKVLCMDEPTAALDSKSENYIRDSIKNMIEGKTVIMVTHRKALLSQMDVIYVLENGKLKDVKQYGGIDAYLTLINNEDGITSAPAQIADDHNSKPNEPLTNQLHVNEQMLADQILASQIIAPKPLPTESATGTEIHIHH